MKLANLLPRSELVICFKCGSIETHTERFMEDATLDTYCFSCEDNANIKVFITNGLNSEQIRNHFMQLERKDRNMIKELSETEVELEITKAIMPTGAKHMIPNDFLPLDQQTNSLGNKFDPDYLDSPV